MFAATSNFIMKHAFMYFIKNLYHIIMRQEIDFSDNEIRFGSILILCLFVVVFSNDSCVILEYTDDSNFLKVYNREL